MPDVTSRDNAPYRQIIDEKRNIYDTFLLEQLRVYYLGPDDIVKIMLATDNHIGFLERDPIRGQDAVNTFEEILQLAVKYDVCTCALVFDLAFKFKLRWTSYY